MAAMGISLPRAFLKAPPRRELGYTLKMITFMTARASNTRVKSEKERSRARMVRHAR